MRQVVLNTDLFGGSLGVVLTLVFWFGRGQWTPLSAMFPNTVLAIMGLLSVALLVKGFVRPEVQALFAEGNRTRVVVTAVALLVWVWAIEFLGFYLASFLVFAALTLYIASASRKLTPQSVVIWLVIIAVELAVLNFVFSRLLFVRLPTGVFSF